MNSVLGDRRAILVLLGPALLVYSLVILVPVFWSLGYSLTSGDPITGFHFVWFTNFAQLVSDPAVRTALIFTLKYALVVTVGQVTIGYALSLLYVFALKNGSTIVRTLVFFPVVLPTVAVALLFQQLFELAPQQGIVNDGLNALGIRSVNWFGTGGSAFVVIAIMDIWRAMGFYGVLLYAGLLDIPEEILESARLDGATGWKLIRNIVLPLSAPVLLASAIFSINGTLKVFDSIYALTAGGPGSSTEPLTMLMFQTSFNYGDYGYGSSIAFLLTILCLVVTLFIFRSTRRDITKG